MVKEHDISKKVKVSDFLRLLHEYGSDNVESTAHTFFRLSQKQRKVYTEEALKKIIFGNKPIEVAIQNNGNYAAVYYFDDKGKLIKVLLDVSSNKIYRVTFYILNREQEKEFKDGKNTK